MQGLRRLSVPQQPSTTKHEERGPEWLYGAKESCSHIILKELRTQYVRQTRKLKSKGTYIFHFRCVISSGIQVSTIFFRMGSEKDQKFRGQPAEKGRNISRSASILSAYIPSMCTHCEPIQEKRYLVVMHGNIGNINNIKYQLIEIETLRCLPEERA